MRRVAKWFVRWAGRAIVVIFIVSCLLIFTPLGDWPTGCLVKTDPLAKADYIVVLGGGGERAVEAAQLVREGWANKVITSTSRADTDDLPRLCTVFGVDPKAISVDLEANRTAMHPHTIAALPGVDPKTQRFIIVTSPFHTSRVKAVFARAGYTNVIVRSPRWRTGGDMAPLEQTWTGRACELTDKYYEVLAWGLYRLRGWV
jgi:uncharacterized SAM-binding protein YcdF (DUF218 family)